MANYQIRLFNLQLMTFRKFKLA